MTCSSSKERLEVSSCCCRGRDYWVVMRWDGGGMSGGDHLDSIYSPSTTLAPARSAGRGRGAEA